MKKMDLSLILGIVVLVAGTFFGTYLIHLSNRKANTDRIEALEKTFTNQNSKLSVQSSKIESILEKTNAIASKVLESSAKIDTNTMALGEITKSIAELTKANNSLAKMNNNITNIIKNEQRHRGDFDFKIKKYRSYDFIIGGNFYNFSRELLEQGVQLKIPFIGGLPVFFKIREDDLFVTTVIKDKFLETLVEIDKNKWLLDKNKTLSINHDENGLEIIDSNGHVTFQVLLQNEVLVVNMALYLIDRAIILSNEAISTISYNDKSYSKEYLEKISKIKRIFKHQGENYIGIRNK